MIFNKNYVIFCAMLMCSVALGQEKKEKRAKEEYQNFAYADAINTYENLVAQGRESEEIYTNLGNAYYYNANYDKAAKWFGKLVELENVVVDPEIIYKYAQTLKTLKKYEESDLWMKKFDVAKDRDIRASKFNNSINYLDKINKNSGRYEISNLAVNSKASDFAPTINGKDLVFSTARYTGIKLRGIHQWNKQSFLNLYKAKISKNGKFSAPTELSNDINTNSHESSAVFTKDGETMYFTRNNSEKGQFSRDKKGVSHLKIYRAELKKGNWTNIVELPFNEEGHSTAHPALNHDETKLYFASDMPGTLGSSDIFEVDIYPDGTFSSPKNLGDGVNTEGRETFPYVTTSDILYFASDGHPGLGGLDIFAAKIDKKDTSDIFSVNVGMPVNSEKDDFSFVINETTKKGFFASNRDGGKGDDDIYAIVETKPLEIIKENATITEIEDSNLNDSVTELLIGESDGLIQESINTINQNGEIGGEETKDLNQTLALNPIYFDLNSSYLRKSSYSELDKIIVYMQSQPNISVYVRSYTDSRGTNEYNKWLSERRSNRIIDYLVSMGVERERLSGEGLSETALINKCADNMRCTEEEHQLNRRSEFIASIN